MFCSIGWQAWKNCVLPIYSGLSRTRLLIAFSEIFAPSNLNIGHILLFPPCMVFAEQASRKTQNWKGSWMNTDCIGSHLCSFSTDVWRGGKLHLIFLIFFWDMQLLLKQSNHLPPFKKTSQTICWKQSRDTDGCFSLQNHFNSDYLVWIFIKKKVRIKGYIAQKHAVLFAL